MKLCQPGFDEVDGGRCAGTGDETPCRPVSRIDCPGCGAERSGVACRGDPETGGRPEPDGRSALDEGPESDRGVKCCQPGFDDVDGGRCAGAGVETAGRPVSRFVCRGCGAERSGVA